MICQSNDTRLRGDLRRVRDEAWREYLSVTMRMGELRQMGAELDAVKVKIRDARNTYEIAEQALIDALGYTR